MEVFFLVFFWKPLSLKMSITLMLGQQALVSAEIIREQRDAEAEMNLL